MSQPINIKLFIKNIKNLQLRLLKWKKLGMKWRPLLKYCEKKTEPTKKGRLCKNHGYFMKTDCTKQKRLFEENKTVMESKL